MPTRRQDAHQRGLAGAVRTKEPEHALGDAQVDSTQGGDGICAGAIGLREPVDVNVHRFATSWPGIPWRGCAIQLMPDPHLLAQRKSG
jgi:hypothetical protein